MDQLFRLSSTHRRDPAVDAWLDACEGALGEMARHWFGVLRQCGAGVREAMHDGQPTACLSDAAFAYVDAYSAHVNVGFFRGAELPDPAGLLQGTGRFMRHVKLRSGGDVDACALVELVARAHDDMRRRLVEEA